jgi:hypothetical protein
MCIADCKLRLQRKLNRGNGLFVFITKQYILLAIRRHMYSTDSNIVFSVIRAEFSTGNNN